jgi:hypothetical protein
MEQAVGLYRTAASCFGSVGEHRGGRLVLSLFFKAVLGIQRIFHFDSLNDEGLALLTGGRRTLSRSALGALVRAVSSRAVGRFVRLTQPVVSCAQRLLVSIDEHAVARFTRKFLIPKGFHTIRNKKMRVEKLFFSFDTGLRTLLDLVVTPGDARLATVASKMLAALRARYRRTALRVVLDAGAAQSHRELLQVVDQNPNQVVLARTPRRTAYLKHWKALPEGLFTSYEEPGRYKGARAKRIHVAETTTALRADSHSATRQVRTIVAREEGRRGKHRWHALFVFRDNATEALTLIQEFRARQHHEQTYRVLLHDAFVDAAPSGYSKHSSNPDRPGFRKNALMLYSWLAGLAVNALGHFTASLPERFHRAHPRTLRRWWLLFPAELYLSDKALFVVLHPRWFRDWWQHHIQHLNAKKLRVPWLGDRLVLYSLEAPPFQRREPSSDPSESS